MKRGVVLLALTLVPGPVAAQRVTAGVYGVAVSHIEVQEGDKSTGFGAGGVVQLHLRRFTVEASGYYASLESDQPSLLPFDVIQGRAALLYALVPTVSLELATTRRSVDPDFSAQDVGAVSVGARGQSRLASIATVQARGAYLIAPQFGGGGSAPLSIELGLGATVGSAAGRWRARLGYEFQRLDRSVDGVDVPIQVTLAQLGVDVDF